MRLFRALLLGLWHDLSDVRLEAQLARAGVADRVQRKGCRNRPLSAADRARNREIAVTRGRVEAIFSALKRSWGLARTRFLGEARNAARIALTAIAWNLRKGATLRRSGG